MSLPFSRSIRSVNIDSYRASRIAMVLALAVLLALIIWFFAMKVTIYEYSTELSYSGGEVITARFPMEEIKKISPGQPAIVQIDTGPNQGSVTLPALVVGTETKTGTAELIILSNQPDQIPVDEELIGHAQVEVEYITPANLVRRASGKYVNNSQFPVSPQEIEVQNP